MNQPVTSRRTRVCAPGKLILSGEHAVVYDQPALAMAINRYVTTTITPAQQDVVVFDLLNLNCREQLEVSALQQLQSQIQSNYEKFARGDESIQIVLQTPQQLAQMALSALLAALNVKLSSGLHIEVQSDIPVGCGMGSSAAAIVSLMYALLQYLQLSMTPEALYKTALSVENLQHGRSSGVDLRVAMQGGCLYKHQQQITARPVPAVSMYLVNTGRPISTTGQCIEQVANHFGVGTLSDEFGQITNAMDAALQQADWQQMQAVIRLNHRLLTHIGVVPVKVQQFIAQVEAAQGAAKICGAGAVIGDQAGSVLVIMEDVDALSILCDRYGYTVQPVIGESRGVYAV